MRLDHSCFVRRNEIKRNKRGVPSTKAKTEKNKNEGSVDHEEKRVKLQRFQTSKQEHRRERKA